MRDDESAGGLGQLKEGNGVAAGGRRRHPDADDAERFDADLLDGSLRSVCARQPSDG